MKLSARKLNLFLFFKMPAAFFCGVRVKSISEQFCVTSVKHRWINQNPFKSMYWAVQGMAAELSTGALVSKCISESGANISMLVANNKGNFTKKAKGRINFTCNDGHLLREVIAKVIETDEGQTLWMTSLGIDTQGNQVSRFEFEWTIKLRKSK